MAFGLPVAIGSNHQNGNISGSGRFHRSLEVCLTHRWAKSELHARQHIGILGRILDLEFNGLTGGQLNRSADFLTRHREKRLTGSGWIFKTIEDHSPVHQQSRTARLDDRKGVFARLLRHILTHRTKRKGGRFEAFRRRTEIHDLRSLFFLPMKNFALSFQTTKEFHREALTIRNR